MISVLGSLKPRDKFPWYRQPLVKGKDRGDDVTGSVLGLQTKRMGWAGRCCPTLVPGSRGWASPLVGLALPISIMSILGP